MNKLFSSVFLITLITGCVSVVPYVATQAYEGEPLPMSEVARIIPLLQGQVGGRLNLYTIDGENVKNPKTGLPPSEVQVLPGKRTVTGTIQYAGCSSAVTIELEAKKGGIYYLNFSNENTGTPIFWIREEAGGNVVESEKKLLGKSCATIYIQI